VKHAIAILILACLLGCEAVTRPPAPRHEHEWFAYAIVDEESGRLMSDHLSHDFNSLRQAAYRMTDNLRRRDDGEREWPNIVLVIPESKFRQADGDVFIRNCVVLDEVEI